MFKQIPLFFATLVLTLSGCQPKSTRVSLSASPRSGSQTSAESVRGVNGNVPEIWLDTNRDGRISDKDQPSQPWSWNDHGALVLANVDDDNRDGRADCLDEVVNGPDDEKDLTLIQVRIPEGNSNDLDRFKIRLSASSTAAPLRWFLRTPAGWKVAEQSVTLGELQRNNKQQAELGIESCAFASTQWDGFLSVSILTEEDTTLNSTTLRVSPFLMIPNTARMETLYISRDASGRYGNTRMLFELPLPLLMNSVSIRMYRTDAWEEMWMQDTMEIGYSETPTSRMHVVLNAPRGKDRFGPTLLGPDLGFIEIAQPRELTQATDGWIDWFGNLEVSPATEKYPFGRVYYGKNPATGNSMHPEIVGFLNAQVLQQPIALDTGWLFIKHVDEMLTFWPSANNRGFVAVMASPRRASEILKSELDETNSAVQRRLSAIVDGSDDSPSLIEAFGLNNDQLVFAPILYSDAEHGAVGQWSNPVNSVAMNNAVLFGRTDVPDPILSSIKKLISDQRLAPMGVDDSAYQPRLGNVHCGTNALRRMPKVPFWGAFRQ